MPQSPNDNEASAIAATDPGAALEDGAFSRGRGSLSREMIRGTIRVHINEIRACYETGLTQDGALSGRVVISFIIGADGHVSTSEIANSTMSPRGAITDAMERCIRDAVRTFVFPRPEGGGGVLVNYPFILDSEP